MAEDSAVEVKSGWRTSEFWFSLAAQALSFLFMSGVFDVIPGSADDQIAGFIALILTNLGYQVSRGLAKKR